MSFLFEKDSRVHLEIRYAHVINSSQKVLNRGLIRAFFLNFGGGLHFEVMVKVLLAAKLMIFIIKWFQIIMVFIENLFISDVKLTLGLFNNNFR